MRGRASTTIAVEPAPGMLKVLKHTVSRAQVLAGSAEELPLPDAAVDLVAVGQAFHWFDLDRALPEIARVLRPGGRLALFYNSRDDVGGLGAGAGRADRRHRDHADAHRERDPRVMGPFEPEAFAEFRHQQELDADGAGRAGRHPQLRDPDAAGGAGGAARPGPASWPGPTRSWSAGSTSTCRTWPRCSATRCAAEPPAAPVALRATRAS